MGLYGRIQPRDTKTGSGFYSPLWKEVRRFQMKTWERGLLLRAWLFSRLLVIPRFPPWRLVYHEAVVTNTHFLLHAAAELRFAFGKGLGNEMNTFIEEAPCGHLFLGEMIAEMTFNGMGLYEVCRVLAHSLNLSSGA